jgi:hypothetical protein
LRPHAASAALLLAFGVASAPFAVHAAAEGSLARTDGAACEGFVYLDRDGDGRRDRGEPGVVGARVSDGVAVVEADAGGRYRLPTDGARPAFLIKPAGHVASNRDDGLPDTWQSAGGCRDFGLRRERTRRGARPLEVLVFGDPQPKTEADLRYYEADIVAPLRGAQEHPPADLALGLGDIVDDKPGLYPGLKRIEATLGLPWLHAPGNHDVDAGDADDAASLDGFHAAFGPDTFAWEETQANFLVLDDVIVLAAGGSKYVGGLRPQQFAFLEAYLAKADPARLLVLAMHIPLFDVGGKETFRHADRERLFALLSRFPRVLVLSAHTHQQQHFFHGPESGWKGATPLHEYNVGAACGSYWTGVKDAAGIPAATMIDGTPNGYARLRVEAGGKPSLRWYAARMPAEAQIGLHAPKLLRRGAWPGFGVYANVWMGQADTVVEYRIDAGDWKPMLRVARPDPDLLAENVRDDEATALRSYNRLPEAVPSEHLWRGMLPTDLAVGAHQVEVRAQIEGFGDASAGTVYELREVAP